MAESPDTGDPLDRMLEGWGTPEARPEFVDRVLARIDAPAPQPPRRARWRSVATFAAGSLLGGLLVAAVTMRDGGRPPGRPASARPIHLQAPGVADVVGEPGSVLQWERREDGRFVVDVVEGVALVRRDSAEHELGVVADGEEVRLGGPCGRVEVTRGLFSVDATVDDVDCERVDDAIERARAELSDDPSR